MIEFVEKLGYFWWYLLMLRIICEIGIFLIFLINHNFTKNCEYFRCISIISIKYRNIVIIIYSFVSNFSCLPFSNRSDWIEHRRANNYTTSRYWERNPALFPIEFLSQSFMVIAVSYDFWGFLLVLQEISVVDVGFIFFCILVNRNNF